jgi:alcohol dehydrogenase class IV
MPVASLEYDFLAPPRIVFGWGRRTEVGRLAVTLGRRALVVTGSRTLAADGRLDEILASVRQAGLEVLPAVAIDHEPEAADVDRAVEHFRAHRAGDGDFVLAVGGGSAIDLAKAAAALLTQTAGAPTRDYLEGVGRGLEIESPPLPVLAMPTTAGTGSEATKNAVISSYDPPFKKSLRNDQMVPRIVLVDPELTVSLPPRPTAWTGMDAVTQLIESYTTKRARPIAQTLAIDGLRRAGPALVAAVREGSNRAAREAMSQAALLSGLALANSGLGMAHGVAAALGAVCRVPHGLACAVMLPVAMRINRPVREREFARIGEALAGHAFESDAAGADAAFNFVDGLVRELTIPTRLGEIGVRREQLGAIVAGSRGNSMNGNRREVPDSELHDLLERML